jgi:hypothetical protein
VELGEFRVIEAAQVQDVSNALPGRLGHFGGIPNTASDCDLLRHPAYVVGDGAPGDSLVRRIRDTRRARRHASSRGGNLSCGERRRQRICALRNLPE